ncbi:MAG: TIR domain-containing protein [Xanthobacteraceae bacterium]
MVIASGRGEFAARLAVSAGVPVPIPAGIPIPAPGIPVPVRSLPIGGIVLILGIFVFVRGAVTDGTLRRAAIAGCATGYAIGAHRAADEPFDILRTGRGGYRHRSSRNTRDGRGSSNQGFDNFAHRKFSLAKSPTGSGFWRSLPEESLFCNQSGRRNRPIHPPQARYRCREHAINVTKCEAGGGLIATQRLWGKYARFAAGPVLMPKIAISYRRSDSEAMTGRVFDRLIAHYGKDAIFRDIDDIPLGIDFRQHINQTLLKTNILLAIIGPEWLGSRGDVERIREEADPVRVEVETALRRRVPIVPVLIGSTKMPTAEQLPPGLKDFAFRNAVKVDTGLDFDFHIDRLIRAMDVILEKAKSPPSGETKIPQVPAKPAQSPAKPPTPEKPAAPASPSSKTFKVPAALVGMLDRGKEKPATSASPPWLDMLWPANRNGRIVRVAIAAVVVILLAVLILPGGPGGERGKRLLTLTGHLGTVTSVAYSPNGRMIVSGSLDRSLKVWDASSGELLRTLSGDYGAVSSVAFLPDGQHVVSSSLKGAIIIWNVDTGQPIRSLRSDANYSWESSPAVRAIAVSPDGARVASGNVDSSVTVWNVASGGVLQIFRSHDQDIETVAFAPDGRMLVAGAKDGTIRVWDTLGGQLLRTLTDHKGQILSVAISPDGNRLAAGGGGNAVKLWNATTGELIRTVTSGSNVVESIAFSPDGRRLAVGGDGSVVELIDANSGQVVESLRGHSAAVRTLAFSPDGRRLAAGSADNTVDVWAVN